MHTKHMFPLIIAQPAAGLKKATRPGARLKNHIRHDILASSNGRAPSIPLRRRRSRTNERNTAYQPLTAPLSFVDPCLYCIPLCFLFAGLFALLGSGALEPVFRWPIRFLSFVGTFTLELYCVHQWLYGKLHPLLEGRVSYLSINLITLPLLILAGYLLHLLHAAFWKAADRARGK